MITNHSFYKPFKRVENNNTNNINNNSFNFIEHKTFSSIN